MRWGGADEMRRGREMRTGLGKNPKSWKNPKNPGFFKIFGFFPGFFQVWVFSRYKLGSIIDLPPSPKYLLEMILLYYFQMV